MVAQKAKLNMTKHGHHMDRWLLRARLGPCPEISSESNSVQTLQNIFGRDYNLV